MSTVMRKGVASGCGVLVSAASAVLSYALQSAPPRPGEQWEFIGPQPWISDGLPENTLYQRYAGRATAIAADPADSAVIYIGTFGGGVWKTLDEGTSWQPLTDTAGSLNIGALTMNGPTLYAGTVAATSSSAIGVLKSSDAGATWIPVGRRLFEGHSVLSVATDPRNADVVFAAIGEIQTQGLAGRKGIWRSTDGGRRWVNATQPSLPDGADVSFNHVVIDPSDTARLFAAVSELAGDTALNGVWLSIDSGARWIRVLNPRELEPSLDPRSATVVAVAPALPRIVYAASAAAPDPFGEGVGKLFVFKSEDGGASWYVVTTPWGSGCPDACQPVAGNAFTLTLAVDPSDPDVVYLADNKRAGSLSISTDGGWTWTDRHIDQFGYTPHADHRAAAFDAAGNYLEADDGGIARYHRDGDWWEDFNRGLGITQINAIQLHPADAETVYGGGIDSGLNWRNRSTLVWRQLPPHHALGDLGAVRIDRQRPDILYAQFTGCESCTMNVLQQSIDGGRTFQEMSTGIAERGGVPPFALDPADTGHLLLATSRLYESRDSAVHWRPIYTFDENARNRARALAVSAGCTSVYVWANTGPMASHDGGMSFQPGQLDPPRQDPFTEIVVSPRNGAVAYAVGPGRDHSNVYATSDGGVCWRSIHHNLPNASANALVVDASGPVDTLYVAIDGGVYVSRDGGSVWHRCGLGLPHGSAKALDINVDLGILVTGLNGRGAWRIRTR